MLAISQNISHSSPKNLTKGQAVLPEHARIVYCIGAQKAGTSWLFDQLQKSPECHGGAVKEMHYFDTLHMHSERHHAEQRYKLLQELVSRVKSGFAPENATLFDQIRQVSHQLECFAASKGDHTAYVKAMTHGRTTEANLLDFTPSYCGMSAEGFSDMAGIGASKFIFILRDPVSRMWSQIRMRTKMLKIAETDQEFYDISAEHAQRLRHMGRYPKIFRANYMKTMSLLEESVPAEDIKYVFYEDLFRQDTMKDLCAFLGIAPVKSDASRQVNLGRSIPLNGAVRALIGSELREQYVGVFDKFGDAVPQKWRDTFKQVEDFTNTSYLEHVASQVESDTVIGRSGRKLRGIVSHLKPTKKAKKIRPVVFLHIPKTAGQTITKQVRLAVGARNVSPIMTHSQAPVEEQFPKGFLYYGGHLDWVAMEESVDDCFSFTVLRDPYERIASLYFFLKRQAMALSAIDLERPEHAGKKFLLEVSADDYFFSDRADMQLFVANGYYNKYCYYFASRRMQGWTDLKNLDEADVLQHARKGIRDISRVYGMSQLDLLERDLSSVMHLSLSLKGPAKNVGPKAERGSRWGDLSALFERDSNIQKMSKFTAYDEKLLELLDFSDGPLIGRGGEI
ncbi:sulfotransferase [Planktotalea sp.]|uniref:sulfotransferase n=1 Tax=Planktotalea sp. TaxID=2029877 RepID=UPI003296B6BD